MINTKVVEEGMPIDYKHPRLYPDPKASVRK
jgi:hypothetical protein